jgi:hypothetical protein
LPFDGFDFPDAFRATTLSVDIVLPVQGISTVAFCVVAGPVAAVTVRTTTPLRVIRYAVAPGTLVQRIGTGRLSPTSVGASGAVAAVLVTRAVTIAPAARTTAAAAMAAARAGLITTRPG